MPSKQVQQGPPGNVRPFNFGMHERCLPVAINMEDLSDVTTKTETMDNGFTLQ